MNAKNLDQTKLLLGLLHNFNEKNHSPVSLEGLQLMAAAATERRFNLKYLKQLMTPLISLRLVLRSGSTKESGTFQISLMGDKVWDNLGITIDV